MKPLVEGLADGDPQAFQAFYDQLSQQLFRFLVAKTGSYDLAGDALQETFLRAVRFREQLRKVNNLDAWIFTVARREADRILTQSSQRRSCSLREAENIQSFAKPVQIELGLREELEIALAILTIPEREIIELHIYGGLKFREVAEVTETPQGTVATRYRAALVKLRKHLARTPDSATRPIKEINQ